jgi:hypothetical protein
MRLGQPAVRFGTIEAAAEAIRDLWGPWVIATTFAACIVP